jgi:putative phosphoesterase
VKIALLSDSHDNWNALRDATATASGEGCEVILFAGDLTRPKGVGILDEFSGPVHMICGNMDHNIDGVWAEAEDTDNVIFHGEVCDIERKGVRIYMQHRPETVETKAQTDTYDLCVHGHLHEFRHERIGGTHLINSGALTRRSNPPEWAIFDTKTQNADRYYP